MRLLRLLLICLCLLLTITPQPSLAEDRVLKGSVRKVLPEDEELTVTLESIISSDFSEPGDPVRAAIGGKGLLAGCELHGLITDIKPSRSAGRAGYMRVEFTEIELPDGSKYPMSGALETEAFWGQEALKTVWYDTKLIGKGALWGAFQALRWVPMAAFGSDGISLGIGAGVGMGLATIGAFRHQGHTRTLYPGEVGMVTLLEGLRIPQQALERAQLERSRTVKELLGFDVKVISAQVRDDERLDKRLIMTLQIVNDSNRPVYPCDIMLMPRGGGKTVVADVVSSGLSLYSALPPSDDPQVLTMSFPLEPGSDPRDYDITLVDPISKDLLAKQHVAKAH